MVYNLKTEKDMQCDLEARVRFASAVFKIISLLLMSVCCR